MGRTRTEVEASREAEDVGVRNLPVPVGPAVTLQAEPHGADSEFAAHLMGQEGQRRGLRAGQPFLSAANHAYNRVEWSGAWDRRARSRTRGRI